METFAPATVPQPATPPIDIPPPSGTNNVVVSDIFTPPPTTTSSAVKKQQKRLRHSNYMRTINTNKSFIDREDPALHALTEKLRACMDKTFNNSNLGKYR